jgi:hypothetical protein
MRAPSKQIAIGCIALATVPVVGWLAFSYHVMVGVAVSIIYGAGAGLVGVTGVVRGVATLAEQARARRAQLEDMPRARLVERDRD